MTTANRRGAGGVLYADEFPGADAGAKIQAAISALGTSSGVINAQRIRENQNFTEPLTLGIPGESSVELVLGKGGWSVFQPITVLMRSSIVGSPVGTAVGGVDQTATNVVAASGANLAAVVQVGDGTFPGGFNAVLQDLVVDGNKTNGGTAASGAAILANGADRIDVTRVTAQNAAGDGIRVQSSTSVKACCSNFTKVMAVRNNDEGLELRGTGTKSPNDVMVAQSSFENNAHIGLLLMNASALRVTNSDFGGNQTGLRAEFTAGSTRSCCQLITGNQFGNQSGHDILMTSAGFPSVINDNYFIGSGRREAGHDAIQVNSNGSTITGNFINMVSSPAQLSAGVRLVNTTARSLVTSNTFAGGAPENHIVGFGIWPANPQEHNLS